MEDYHGGDVSWEGLAAGVMWAGEDEKYRKRGKNGGVVVALPYQCPLLWIGTGGQGRWGCRLV